LRNGKKTGYERLCSTYVINPSNYKFGNTSICRVPWNDRSDAQKGVHDPTTGCLGCASRGGGPRNIFGNKYGQYLAAVQVAREERIAKKKLQQQKMKEQAEQEAAAEAAAEEQEQPLVDNDDDGEAPTDDDDDDDDNAPTDDDDDFGPSPAAGIWAGSQKLERKMEQMSYPDGNDDSEKRVDVDVDVDEDEPQGKKQRNS